MTETHLARYRQLSAQLGGQPACALLDKLQVLALTQPETLREIEAFIDRGLMPGQPRAAPKPDRRQQPDRRKASMLVAQERRRVARRAGEINASS
jgi:hypothetical protein